MKTRQFIHLLITIYLIKPLMIFSQGIPADSIYFGFTPADDSAIVFAPGIISLPGRLERTPNYFPDYSEFYFTTTATGSANAFSTIYQNKWNTPTIDSSFKINTSDLSISESGSLACFTSWEGAYDWSKNTDIWIVERTDTGWGEPVLLPEPINSNIQEWGEHELTWQPTGLPSGIYFYRLQTGDPAAGSGQRLSETKKLILQK